MEDLLTSIRQAINENVGLPSETSDAPAAEPSPEPPINRAEEIAQLRDRIASQLREPRDPSVAAVSHASGRPGGFAGLMGGELDPIDEELPPLRSRALEDEPAPNDVPASEPPPAAGRGFESSFTRSWNATRRAYVPRDTYAERALLSPAASAATNAAFGRLAESMVARAIGDHTIEQMTQDLLRGMLKTWLDDNLPGIVERLVREEIERVARRGSYR